MSDRAAATGGGTEAVAPSGPLEAGLDEPAWFLRVLWGLDRELRAASRRMGATQGVSGRERFALRMLRNAPGLSAGQLAELLQLDPSTLTGVLRRLEDRGLIIRVTCVGDLRRHSLQLTEAGQAAEAQREGTVEAAIRRALQRCQADKVSGAKDVLASLLSQLRADRRAAAIGPGSQT